NLEIVPSFQTLQKKGLCCCFLNRLGKKPFLSSKYFPLKSLHLECVQKPHCPEGSIWNEYGYKYWIHEALSFCPDILHLWSFEKVQAYVFQQNLKARSFQLLIA